MKTILSIAFATTLMVGCNNNSSNKTDNMDTTSRAKGDTNLTDNNYSNAGNENAATVNDTDRDFVMKAAIANNAEIGAGKLAQEKGSTADVKDFGKMMETDHSDALAKLKTAVSGSGLMVSDSLDKKHTDMKAKLQSLSGKNFDAEFSKGMVSGHQDAIALFEKEASSGGYAPLKDYANAMLPHLKMHLEKAEKLPGK